MAWGRYSVKKHKEEAESPFWISYSDLMTALMILFLVIMAVSLMLMSQKIRTLTDAENNRSQAIQNICQQINDKSTHRNHLIKVDCTDNRINFGEAGRFAYNDYHITPAGTQALQDVVPIILDVANGEEGKNWLKQVVIEGFTDTDGSYLYNLHLSMQRSEWVMCSLVDSKLSQNVGLTPEQMARVKELFLAGGVSFNNAKENKDSSRRVELRMQFYGLDEKKQKETAINQSTLSEGAVIEKCQL